MSAKLNIVSHYAKKKKKPTKNFHKQVPWSYKTVLYLLRTNKIMKKDRVANGKLS